MSFPLMDPNNANDVLTRYDSIRLPPNSSFLFSPPPPHPPPSAAVYHQQQRLLVGGGGGRAAAAAAPLTCCPKRLPTVRGDRHSKIRTAQGLRDRRVRLSIGIARKFFDLQDLLGFDKASKTLDWLLGQSETAIHELERMRKPVKARLNMNMEEEEEQQLANGQQRREMARARARERTREKMINKLLTSEDPHEEEDDEEEEEMLVPLHHHHHHHLQQIGSNPKVHDLITAPQDDIVISPNSPLLISWDLGTPFSQNQAFLF